MVVTFEVVKGIGVDGVVVGMVIVGRGGVLRVLVKAIAVCL